MTTDQLIEAARKIEASKVFSNILEVSPTPIEINEEDMTISSVPVR